MFLQHMTTHLTSIYDADFCLRFNFMLRVIYTIWQKDDIALVELVTCPDCSDTCRILELSVRWAS